MIPEGINRSVCQGVAYYHAPAFDIPVGGDPCGGIKVSVGIMISHMDWPEKMPTVAEQQGFPPVGDAFIFPETIYLGGDSPGEMTIVQAEALRDALDKIIKLAKNPPRMKTPTWVEGKYIPQDAPETQDLFV